MNQLGVYITLQNDENLIEECWRRVTAVFDSNLVWVCDLGSRDSGAVLVGELGAQVEICGRIAPEDYAAWKNDRAKPHDQVLWIDADEWWPADALHAIRNRLYTADFVAGRWRNLKRQNGQLYVSEPVYRGRIAWCTDRYRVGRTWPRERLETFEGKSVPNPEPPDPRVYCWHGVLLERSSVPEDSSRATKRLVREKQFEGLEWTETSLEKLT